MKRAIPEIEKVDELYFMTDPAGDTYLYEDIKTWVVHYMKENEANLKNLIMTLECGVDFDGKEELSRAFRGLPYEADLIDVDDFLRYFECDYTWGLADQIKRKK